MPLWRAYQTSGGTHKQSKRIRAIARIRWSGPVAGGLVLWMDWGKATCETRTRDLSFTKAPLDIHKADSDKDLESWSDGQSVPESVLATDPDLIRIAEAWPDLPEPIRAAILTLIASL